MGKENPFDQFKPWWEDEKDFIARRKQEWKRLKHVFWRKSNFDLKCLREFCVSGYETKERDKVTFNIFSLAYWQRFLLTPWETKEQLLELINVINKEYPSNFIAASLIKTQFVKIEHSISNYTNEHYWFDDNRQSVIEDILGDAEVIWDEGLLIDGNCFRLDFTRFVDSYEFNLWRYLTQTNYLWFYNNAFAKTLYRNTIRYYETCNVPVEHHERIKEIISLCSHYSPVQLEQENRRLSIELASDFKHWLQSEDCPAYFKGLIAELGDTSIEQIPRASDPEGFWMDNVKFGTAKSGPTPGFIYNCDLPSVISTVISRLKTLDVISDVRLDQLTGVDLTGEIQQEFAASTGLLVDGIIPAVKISIKPQLTFDSVSGIDKTSFWLDIYCFTSAQIADVSFGKLSAYIMYRFADFYRDYCLHLPLFQLCMAVKVIIEESAGCKITIPWPNAPDNHRCAIPYDSKSLHARQNLVDWGIEGPNVQQQMDLSTTDIFKELEQCLK